MAQTFEDAGKAGREMMDNSLKSFAAVSKGMQALAVGASDYTKQSFETGSAAMEKLVAARSLEKAIEIQTDYARAAYESFVAEASRVSDIYAEMAKDAYKPFEGMVAKVR